MRKLLFMLAFVCSTFAIQAQKGEISINGGFLNQEAHLSADEDLVRFGGNLEIGMDLFSKNKFKFGPVGKLHFVEQEFMGGKDQNDYVASLGLNAGFDAGRWSFDSSVEVPFPDQREDVFELLISPSATLMIGKDKNKGLGLKANFDYFINKKLFTYAYQIGGGVVYKF